MSGENRSDDEDTREVREEEKLRAEGIPLREGGVRQDERAIHKGEDNIRVELVLYDNEQSLLFNANDLFKGVPEKYKRICMINEGVQNTLTVIDKTVVMTAEVSDEFIKSCRERMK
jgi:hypothetical protein